jgi:peptidoglycan-associated lipoprotein
MKKVLPVVVCLIGLAFAVTGCKKKPEYPLCKSSKDCKEGEMCVDGKCVQCQVDSDCPSGEKCVQGVCSQASADAAGKPGTIAAGSVTSSEKECSLENIYFDFDSAVLRPDAVSALKETAQCLIKKGAKNIIVEGHCDPRGTEEYNMGLGLERANAVKKFLVNYGISKKEIKVFSKGEEEASGTDEETWSYDRKGTFK